jgi:hypothetical protein
MVARGAAFGDLNNDGQVDIVVGVLNGSPVVLRNNGTKSHWLGIRLVGSESNRDGIGARVIVSDSSGRRQIFDESTAGSYLSASDPRMIAGLGNANAVRTLEVHWPSGRKQIITNPELDRYLTINERDAPNQR